MPFDELVRAVGAERERAQDWEEFYYSPSLDNLVTSERPAYAFDFAELPGPSTAKGATFTLAGLEEDAGPFEVRLSIRDHGAGLLFRAHHEPNRLCTRAVRRRLDHLATLLAEAARAPGTPIGLLIMLSPDWRRRVVSEWNRTMPEGPAPSSIPVHRRFESQADETPDVPAVTFLDEACTFAELDRRANRIARWLIRNGVGAEVPVGLLLDRSADMVAAVLGVWKAGGCYVPLDPSHPEARLARILETVQPPVILTQGPLAHQIAGTAARVLALDADDGALAREETTRPGVAVHPDQLAYIIFTSGSTGEPKGVAVSHRSVANLREALAATVYAGFGPGSRVGLNAPLSFDASVKQFLQLTRGCTLCLVPDDLRRDGPALLDYARSQQIAALDLTPSHLRLLMADPDTWKSRPFRRLLLGGESLDRGLWGELSSTPGLTAFNVYGPTECTDVATTAAIVQRERPDDRTSSPEPARLHPRRRAPAGRARRPGRDLHRRCRRRSGISPPLRLDRRTLPPRPIRGDSRRADVPDRRPRPIPLRRPDRLRGPERSPVEGARVPHRAGRDRSSLEAASRRQGGRRRGPDLGDGRPPTGCLHRPAASAEPGRFGGIPAPQRPRDRPPQQE